MEELLSQLAGLLPLQLGDIISVAGLFIGSTALSYTIYISRKQSKLDKKMLQIIEELHTKNKNEEYIQNSIKSQALRAIMTHLGGSRNLLQNKLERIELSGDTKERKLHMIFDELRVSKSEFIYRYDELRSHSDATRYFIASEIYEDVVSVAKMMYALCITGPKEPFPQMIFLDLPDTLDNWTRYARSTLEKIGELVPKVRSELEAMNMAYKKE